MTPQNTDASTLAAPAMLPLAAAAEPGFDLDEAARCFAAWAAAEGLMEVAAPDAPMGAAELADIPAAAKAALRVKGLLHVGFNAADGTICALLKRAAPTSKRGLAAFPNSACGWPIRYLQVVAQDIAPIQAMAASAPAWRQRPCGGAYRYTCGSSISPGNYRDAGTLGALVTDATGALYGLTNNHVSGACNHSQAGLPILAPGVLDVGANGIDPFTIGHHHALLTLTPGDASMVNPQANLDAALFKIQDPARVTSFQGTFYDTPTAVLALSTGQAVEKVGRTTGHTTGRVEVQIQGPFAIRYAADAYGFTGHVLFDPVFLVRGSADVFAAGGDSGSLIVAVQPDGSRAAVGIVVGVVTANWAPGGLATVALPIQPILSRLGVTLVSAHNV